MHQYERNGVVVDQCGDCRGIFLDRGELERLAEAESRWAERTYAEPQPRQGREYGGGSYERRPHKRKKGWIEELFD
jgi:hypothetical protein